MAHNQPPKPTPTILSEISADLKETKANIIGINQHLAAIDSSFNRTEAHLNNIEAALSSIEAQLAAIEYIYPPLIPNLTTIEAMRAAERGEFTGSFDTVEALMKDLNSDDEEG
jgi:hypothetical protein